MRHCRATPAAFEYAPFDAPERYARRFDAFALLIFAA